MPIELTIDRAKQLTILKVTGDSSVEEIMGALDAYYRDHPTRNSLWDFSEGTVASFSLETLGQTAEHSMALAREYSEIRQPGLTVAVAPKDIDFGIANQYISLSIDSPHRLKVCRSMAEAVR
jgi:hypothetical protein